MRRRTVLSFAAVSVAGLVPLRTAARAEAAEAAQALAPGVTLERSTSAGPVRQVLVRLAAGASTRPVLLQQTLSSPRTPAELASAAGAVAAVNGDFFDIDRTGTPDGPVVLDGRAVKASADPQWAVGLEGDGTGWRGRVGRVVLQGSAAVGGRSFPLAALCTRTVPADALVLFGPAWGAGDRSLTTVGGVELEVRGGAVTAVRAPGPVPVPADGGVLVASGTVAAALASTPLGTPVTTDVRVLDDALPPGAGGFAVGARLELVRDGALAPIDGADPTWAALRARSAVGWTAAGDLLLLTVEGGTARSVGVTAVETARRMLDAGALGAVMLDGGGSAQLVARVPGDATVTEAVVPSDGAARPVAHVLALVPAAAGPEPRSVVLRPLTSTGEAVAVFPGLGALLRVVPSAPRGHRRPASLSWRSPRVPSRCRTAGPTRPAVSASPSGASHRVRRRCGPSWAAPPGPSTCRCSTRWRGSAPTDRSSSPRRGRRSTSWSPAATRAAGRRPSTPPTSSSGPTRRCSRPRCCPTAGCGSPPCGRSLLVLGAARGRRGRRRRPGGGRDPCRHGGPARGPVPLDRGGRARRRLGACRRRTGPAAGLRLHRAADRAGDGHRGPRGARPLPVPRGATGLAVSVRGDGAGGWLRGVVRVDGASRPLTFASRVGATGWQRFVADLPPSAREVLVERLYLAQTSVAARGAGALDLAGLEAQVPPLPSGAGDVSRRSRPRR